MSDSTPSPPVANKESAKLPPSPPKNHKTPPQRLLEDNNYRVLFIIFPLCALLISLFIMTTSSERQVLPSSVRPTHYDITLTPDLKNFIFTGSEAIE